MQVRAISAGRRAIYGDPRRVLRIKRRKRPARKFSPETIAGAKAEILEVLKDPNHGKQVKSQPSRSAMVRVLSRQNGIGYNDAIIVRVLEELEREGKIRLPPAMPWGGNMRAKKKRAKKAP